MTEAEELLPCPPCRSEGGEMSELGTGSASNTIGRLSDELTALREKLAAEQEAHGLLRMAFDQKLALLASCETALAERDARIAEVLKFANELRALPAPVEPPQTVPHDRPIWEQWKTTIRCAAQIKALTGAEAKAASAWNEAIEAAEKAQCRGCAQGLVRKQIDKETWTHPDFSIDSICKSTAIRALRRDD